jgi:hypothetical protein
MRRMWSEGSYSYPGRSVDPSGIGTRDSERGHEGFTEVSRGHSRAAGQPEGPNVWPEGRPEDSWSWWSS